VRENRREIPGVRLGVSGLWAEIREDRFVPGSFELVVDGTPQSHVNLDRPEDVFFEYVRRICALIDLIGLPGEPITALHLGAGALTIPRYVEATRPGSTQQVIELERELVDLVRRELPLPPHARLRIRYGDARQSLARLPSGLRGAVDLVVVDIFSGARTPPHVTSAEFYQLLRPLLSGRGIVAVNAADGGALAFARGQAATLQEAIGQTIALAEAQMLKGRRFGNVVLAASPAPIDTSWLPRLLAAGPHPARVLEGEELRRWIAGAPAVSDDTATGSPEPNRGLFGR